MKCQKGQEGVATVFAVAIAVVIAVVIAAALIVSTGIKEVVVPDPVVTMQTIEGDIPLSVYFGKEGKNVDCSRVFGVTRFVESATGVGTARSLLAELLKGPLPPEEAVGLFTSIPEGVVVQSLVIEDGVVMVDFNQTLDENIGGSCRVTSIRSQITETLKGIFGVSEVHISINGETEDILQP